MRMFLVGLVCGVTLTLGIAWLDLVKPSGMAAAEVAAKNIDQCRDAAALDPASLPPRSEEPRTLQVPGTTVLADPRSLSSPTAMAQPGDPAAPDAGRCIITDANVDEISRRASNHYQDRERRSLQSEPRDPMWSAAMEQQVREAIARHALGDRFLLSKVECKTLFCDIEAEFPVSNAQEDVEAFRKVTAEVAQGLGMQVGRGGSGTRSDGLAMDAFARFRRFKPGDECPPGLKADCWNR